jgi:hypothetical protein
VKELKTQNLTKMKLDILENKLQCKLKDIRKFAEDYFGEMIFMDPEELDRAIVKFSFNKDREEYQVVYSRMKVVNVLMKQDDMSAEDAQEWVNYNCNTGLWMFTDECPRKTDSIYVKFVK